MNGTKCLFVGDFRLKIDEIITALEAFKSEEEKKERGNLCENYLDAIIYLGAAHSHLEQIEAIYNADVKGGADA